MINNKHKILIHFILHLLLHKLTIRHIFGVLRHCSREKYGYFILWRLFLL